MNDLQCPPFVAWVDFADDIQNFKQISTDFIKGIEESKNHVAIIEEKQSGKVIMNLIMDWIDSNFSNNFTFYDVANDINNIDSQDLKQHKMEI